MELTREIYMFIAMISMIVLFSAVIMKIVIALKKRDYEQELEESEKFSDEEIRTFNEVEHDIFDKKRVVKQLVAPNGINPKPLGYLIVNDGGVDVYKRTFTIDQLPKKMRFADTWPAIANFEGSTASVFIEPLTTKEASKQLDNHVVELDAEIIHAEKPEIQDRNRARKLRSQRRKTENWADKIEGGDDSFYRVGFLITIAAESLSKLNLMSDTLQKTAQEKGMLLSSCYSVQSEAFKSNMPMNRIYRGKLNASPVKWHLMNKESVACIYNHTTERFMHENGIPLGRNMYTADPVTFDLYHKGHKKGYSVIFSGPMGVGKSTVVKKMMNEFMSMYDYRFVVIDSQSVAGRGEYVNTCLANNGTVFEISHRSKNVANLFDVNEEITAEGKRDLKLSEKIESLASAFSTMLQIQTATFAESTYIRDINMKMLGEAYTVLGIYDGKPDSLYEEGKVSSKGEIVAGKVRKEMPTISSFYKQLLIGMKNETNEKKKEVYDIMLSGYARFVRGVYYSQDKLDFLTKEEFYKLPEKEINKKKYRYRLVDGVEELVIGVEGQSSYFDGQSNVSIDKKCPCTVFDISALPKEEQKMARGLLSPYIEENFVKTNNEDITKAEKLVLVYDEAYEQYNVGLASRKQCSGLSRTCRKKNVGLWWITQACADYDVDDDLRAIFKLSDMKFIFQQSSMDDEFLKSALTLTDNQRKRLYVINGSKSADGQTYSKPGQVCLIDGAAVCFLQVEIMPETEGFIVETDMRKLAKKYGKDAMWWNQE
ncbi:MAG: hypothetical protein K6G88_11020 [Lachnospiraceae bacterium]|nr:hypothetical protein [Lachnospiraceae bacterium]